MLGKIFSKIENLQDSMRILKAWAAWILFAIVRRLMVSAGEALLAAKGFLLSRVIFNLLGSAIMAVTTGVNFIGTILFVVALGFTFGGVLNLAWTAFMLWGKKSGKMAFNTLPEPPAVLDVVGAVLGVGIAALLVLAKDVILGFFSGIFAEFHDKWFLADALGRAGMIVLGILQLALLVCLVILVPKGIKALTSRRRRRRRRRNP